jgi:hypothetical protein
VLLVGDEVVQGFDLVVFAGLGVGAHVVESCVAEHLGDGDQIGTSPDEGGGEGVAQGVSGDLLVDAGGGGDSGDDGVGASRRQPAAFLVEEQRGPSGAGPVGTFAEPVGQRGAQRGVDGYRADLFAFAVEAQGAFAGGQADVVDVQADDFGDAGASVERDQGDGLVAGSGPALDFAQEGHR